MQQLFGCHNVAGSSFIAAAGLLPYTGALDMTFLVMSQVHVVLLNDVILITERGGDGSLTALERPILLKDVTHCTGANSKHRKCYTTSHVSSRLYRHVADL